MFNRWKEYPKNKPNKKGWYQCSIRYGEDYDQAYVMDLYYYPDIDEWHDNRRKTVFEEYDVLDYHGNKLQNIDRLCIRTDVIAFRNMPKIYK